MVPVEMKYKFNTISPVRATHFYKNTSHKCAQFYIVPSCPYRCLLRSLTELTVQANYSMFFAIFQLYISLMITFNLFAFR